MSLKNPSRSAAAVHKVHSYPGEKQNCQNACIARDHAKNQFLTTSPGRERDSCFPIRAMTFPKSNVLKRLVKNHNVECNASTKIMHAMQAKPTTTKAPLSAQIVLPAQG